MVVAAAIRVLVSSALGLAAVACAGGAGRAAEDEGSPAEVASGEPVHGNVRVSWRNLDPRNQPMTAHLVNESSDLGQRLRSGRITSAETRVLTDEEMGVVLAELDRVGFFRYATQGLGLENAPDTPGRRGIVTVERDGRSQGLMLTLGMGPGEPPKVYVASKQVVLAAHASKAAMAISTNLQDPERVFSVPPPRMKRP